MKLLKTIFRLIYTTWCITWFLIPFVVLYPLHLLFTSRATWYKHAHTLNRIWSVVALRGFFLPIEVNRHAKITEKQRYVLVPNHSSYIDIPLLLFAVPGFTNFIGKSSLCNVPLWGPIFRKLYIAVDRNSQLSRAKSYIRSKQTLDEGRNLIVFPEGTISDKAGQELLPFKEGPFKIAIEKQLPLVPVSMPYNHRFLPDAEGKVIVHWHRLKITLHEPIDTTGMTISDVEFLKNKVFTIIQSEYTRHTHEYRYSNHTQVSTPGPAGI